MLMSDHMTEIDHIVHDLEQIEKSTFDDSLPMTPMAHSRILAKEVLEEFMDLLRCIETEVFEYKGIIYDSEMIADMCMLSYCMSRFGHDMLFESDMTFEETCEVCAGIIGCNPEALMHMKNNYDTFFSNIRLGLNQTIVLNGDMIGILNKCEGMGKEEIGIECRRCLTK